MTRIATGTTATREPNFAFGALLFALFGWMNLEVVLLRTNADIPLQALTCAFGLALSTIAYRRYRIWWVPLARSERAFASHTRFAAGQIGHCVALAAAGCALAYSMRAGLVTIAVIIAAITAFVPWSRISFCRKHYYVAHALLAAGGLPILVFLTQHQGALALLAYTSVYWALAAGLIVAVLRSQRSTVYPPGLFR